MARLIDADARVTVQSFDVEHEEYNYTEMSVAEALDFATDEGCPPIIDAVPVVHAYWWYDDLDGIWLCSHCNSGESVERRQYCPDCGAKMDGGETDGKS